MSDIRKSLESLADSIEKIQKQKPISPEITNRSLTGDKIHGGVITKFASVGIKDEGTEQIVTVKDNGLHVDSLYVKKIQNNLSIIGDLDVLGKVRAQKLHVDEISADIRNERTSPLEFKGEDKDPVGKGLIWTGGSYTRQLVLHTKPDSIWSSENIDIHKNRAYMIGAQPVLSEDTLGVGITKSNLKKLGSLENLTVNGSISVDNFVKYNADTEQFSIGAEDPNGMFTIESFDHQFIIDPTDDKDFKIGTWTTSGLDIVTDDTVRIKITNSGKINVKSKTTFQQPIGIGVNNFQDDVDLTVAGAVRIQDKKQEVSNEQPSAGSYVKGDIAWNTDPKPTGYVGWICIKSGTPGDWRPFGQISS